VVTPSCQSFVPIQEATISYRPIAPTLGSLVPEDGGRVFTEGSWPGPMQLFSARNYRLYDPRTFRLTTEDGRVFVVDQANGLEEVIDLNGNTLHVSSAGVTNCPADTPPTSASCKGIVFGRDAEGRISTITDPNGHATRYGYDPAGDLVAFTDREENTTRFSYKLSRPHHLEEIKDPLGRTPIRNEYYDDGRLKSHTDAFGKTITYSHDLDNRQEVVTDREGAVRVLAYDERGNVVKEVQPNGKLIRRTFDPRNNRLTETEPHVDGTANPPTTTYTYDTQDNLLTTTDPENNKTEYAYNGRKQVLTMKDARGKTTTNTYDPTKGNLLTTKDALDHVTTYAYDPRGNVLSQTVVVDGVTHVTGYTYDGFGNLTKETDASGHETSYTYDTSGNRLTQTTKRTTPAGLETLTTTYEYDKQGRLTKTIDPDNSFTRTVYDGLGRQIETHDKLDHVTRYTYDEMGRLEKTTYPDLTTDESTFDGEGRRLTSKDRGGRTTTYEYDSLGRLKKTIYADTTFTENTYDDAGRLVATKDARGKTTTYEYDSAGRRTKVKDPLNHETVFTYDANGNQKTVKDARLNTITYEYDDLNRRTKTIFPSADGVAPPTVTQTTYDELGHRTSETDQAGKTTSFRYDKLGRLLKVIDALDQETTYGYDELGNRTSQADAKNHVTKFEYDKLGRQTKRILPDGKSESMTYDLAGNIETRTDFMGRTTTYTYDNNNRLTSRTYPNPEENISFTYTATGRRQTATDSRGTTTYDYDNRDRLKTLTQPGFGTSTAKLDYTYDGNGNRLTLTATIGSQAHTTSYTYDDAGRLHVMTDPANRTYDHDYDQNGNRATLTQPNGAVTAYTYDTLNRLTNLGTTIPSLSRTIQSYGFTLGPAGNRTKITEHDGTVRDYSYDSLYRLTGEKVTESIGLVYEKIFGYDAVGNRHIQTTTLGPAGSPGPVLQAGTITYGYDDRDRLTLEASQAYTWDANGNLTTKDAEAVYTWNHENRLTKVQKADGTIVTHVYDADGNRVQTKTTPPAGSPTTTNFLVDTSGGLSHVVAESDASASISSFKALYIRGDDLLAVMRPLVPAPSTTPSDWQTRFTHLDGLGSLRRLTDDAGSITDAWSYTAFGELYARTGTDPIPYAFAGEPLDPNSGFQYHRARWMDPRTGRFAGMDPFAGRAQEPASLHRYLYASANPISLLDPSGWEPRGLRIGKKAHALISGFYALLGAQIDTGPRASGGILGGQRWRTDIRFDRDGQIAGGRVLFPGSAGEVYEIKSARQQSLGFASSDLRFYIDRLQASVPARNWREGVSVIPMPPSWPGGFVDPTLSHTVMKVQLVAPGEITYEFIPLPTDPEQTADELASEVLKAGLAISLVAAEIMGEIGLAIAI
jgi:RHS repeat-associated protein